MATTLDRIRLAVTTFEDPEQLWATAAELISRGIEAEQLCVLAIASAMSFLRRTRPAEGQAVLPASLCSEVYPYRQLRSGEKVLASSGPVLDLLRDGLHLGDAAQRVLVDDNSLDPEGLLRQGAATLVVLSNEASQQRIATQTLLKNSQHRVKTFEIAPASELEVHRA